MADGVMNVVWTEKAIASLDEITTLKGTQRCATLP